MAVVPRKIVERVAFFKARLTLWLAEASNIGTTVPAVTDLQTKTNDAEAAVAAHQAAEDALRAAALDVRIKVDAMSIAGAAIIQQVRAKAAIAGDGIFVLANLPARATPSPVGPPGTPYQFKVFLNPADGSLKLTFKCDNPSGGTIYEVSRRNGGSGAFTPIGSSGKREFTDPTIPAGTTSVAYRIQAARSTLKGAPADFTVNFGVGGGGEMTASVAAAPKLAA
jgi:hypothetical protein